VGTPNKTRVRATTHIYIDLVADTDTHAFSVSVSPLCLGRRTLQRGVHELFLLAVNQILKIQAAVVDVHIEAAYMAPRCMCER
jgi:hypothetical protein